MPVRKFKCQIDTHLKTRDPDARMQCEVSCSKLRYSISTYLLICISNNPKLYLISNSRHRFAEELSKILPACMYVLGR